MSENTPGTWLAPTLGADLKVAALDDPVILKAVEIFYDLCASTYGPKGRLKVIHNNIGGHVTVTSSCNRLLNSMTFTNPIIKLIVSAVNGHLHRFRDGGLFIIVFATALIKTSSASSVPRHLLMEIYETFLRYGIDILNGDFSCKKYIDFGSSEYPKILIRSILSTKVGCCLFGDDIDFLTSLVFRAFLSVSPRQGCHGYGTLIYMTAEGLPLKQSTIYEGTLIDTPHILPYRAKDWRLLGPPKSNKTFVALFTMSLSGDAEESSDADYEIEESIDATSAMLNNIKCLMDHLVEAHVRLVCCQRVIHPQIKAYLRSKEVTALDRLGKNNIQDAKQVTGGQLIGSLSQGFYSGNLGTLDDVTAVVLNQRTYLHLRNTEAQVSTILLGHRTEEALEELKTTCIKCEEVLKWTLTDNRVLSGGGCWQAVLISAIEAKVRENEESIKNLHDCSSCQLQSAWHSFKDSVKLLVSALNRNSSHLTDTSNQHHWKIDNCDRNCDWSIYPEFCECGSVAKTTDTELKFLDEKYESQILDSDTSAGKMKILDSFPVMVNAFQSAVSVANLVLGIENIIVDKN